MKRPKKQYFCKKCLEPGVKHGNYYHPECKRLFKFILISCEVCGKIRKFWPNPKRHKPHKCKVCDLADRFREKNSHWKGGKQIRPDGYTLLPKDRFSLKKSKQLEHRIVFEKKIQRFLKPKEVIHHIDANPMNNLPENLLLFRSNSPHARLHSFCKRHSLSINLFQLNQSWL